MKKQILYALGLALVGLLVVTGCTIGPEDPPPEVAAEEEDSMSADAAAIATINAAPEREIVEPTAEPTEEPTGDNGGGETVASAYDPAVVAEGEIQFASTCSACHGLDALGIENLGKDLVNSEFVSGSTDDALLAFVKTGRPIWDAANTTGVDMPPKGGNPALTDDNILAIIAYIRTLHAGAGGAGEETSDATDTEETVAAGSYDEATITQGQTVFSSLCFACHGMDARGLPGLGKDLLTSAFVAENTDEELLAFVIAGRPIDDPANTTGVAMPARGGNPDLSDDDILSAIAYIRTLAAALEE